MAALVGNWGVHIIFQVGETKVLNFRNMQKKVGARWAIHEIVNGRPKSEFLGPDLVEVTMDIVVSGTRGVNVVNVLNSIEKAIEEGRALPLFIGGKRIGQDSMYIPEMPETWDHVWQEGQLMQATLTPTFREYA